jgi:hypothetical protein
LSPRKQVSVPAHAEMSLLVWICLQVLIVHFFISLVFGRQGSGGGGGLSAAEKELLSHEEAIRTHVKKLQVQVQAALLALTAALRCCGDRLGSQVLLDIPALLQKGTMTLLGEIEPA